MGPDWRPWHGLVGTMPDRELGRLYGVSYAWVSIVRKRMGIPAFPGRRYVTVTVERPGQPARRVVGEWRALGHG